MIRHITILISVIFLVNLLSTGKAWPGEDSDVKYPRHACAYYTAIVSNYGVEPGHIFKSMAEAQDSMGDCHEIYVHVNQEHGTFSESWFIGSKIIMACKDDFGTKQIILRQMFKSWDWCI